MQPLSTATLDKEMPDARKAILTTGLVTRRTGNMVGNAGTIPKQQWFDQCGLDLEQRYDRQFGSQRSEPAVEAKMVVVESPSMGIGRNLVGAMPAARRDGCSRPAGSERIHPEYSHELVYIFPFSTRYLP
jgi:hypothetical protein